MNDTLGERSMALPCDAKSGETDVEATQIRIITFDDERMTALKGALHFTICELDPTSSNKPL